MTRRAWLALLAGVALACSGDDRSPDAPTPHPGPRSAPPAEHAELYFSDISHARGLGVVQVTGNPEADYIIDTLGTGAALLDYDGDGDADLYLAQGAVGEDPGPPDVLLRNDGDPDGDGVPEFVNVTAAAGLGDRTWSFGVAAADYDSDGDDDLYLLNWGADRLYRNDGDGTFTEIAAAAGIEQNGWSVSASWGDVDLDGDLDLYVANYVEFDFDRYPKRGQPGKGGAPPCRWRDIEVLCGPRNLESGRNAFYRNDGDPDGDGIPRFVEASDSSGLDPAHNRYSLAVLFFDGNGDLAPDLYVANDSVPNSYYINDGRGRFEELGVLTGLAYSEQGHEQASMGIVSTDYNGDGLPDLVVTNFSHDHDTLYRNDGDDVFTDVSYAAGIGAATYLPLAWGLVAEDLDEDGWSDLFIANGHIYPQVDDRAIGTEFRQRNGLFRNTGQGRFEEVAAAGPGLERLESSRSAMPFDLEGDGDIDLVVTNVNAPPTLLRNDGSPGHWLAVRLEGRESNRDGLGALVLVTAGGKTQSREITRTASFAASRLPIAHFGLGAEERVERLEVRWPSGRVTTREDVARDQLLTLTEGE